MGYFCWNRPVLTELVIRGILLGLLKLVEFYWVFMVYYLIYGVLLKLTGFGCFLLGFYGLKWVLLGFDGLLCFFFRVLLFLRKVSRYWLTLTGLIETYWVLLGFYGVLPRFPGVDWLWLLIIWLYRVKNGFFWVLMVWYRVLQGSTGFNLIIRGSNGFLLGLTRFDWF